MGEESRSGPTRPHGSKGIVPVELGPQGLDEGEVEMKHSVGNKIVLIGAGDVGVAYAYALVNQGTVDHLAIIDIDEKKLEGNVADLNHGVVWASSRTA